MIDQSKKFVSTATIILFLLSMLTAVPKVGAVGPAITLSTSTIATGQVFTVIGTGFPASTSGAVWIDVTGTGKIDLPLKSQPFASMVATTTTGGFTVTLFASGIGAGTYNVLALIPLSGTTVSTPLTIQEPAASDIQNLQTSLSNQITSAQQSLSSQTAAVQSDLDKRIGSPNTGSSDTLFSLLYGIQNSITSGFQALSTQISQLSSHVDTQFGALSAQVTTLSSSMNTGFNSVNNNINAVSSQLTSFQTDLDAKVGSPSVQCAGCPPNDTVFSLLYDVQSLIGNPPCDPTICIGDPRVTIFGNLQLINSKLVTVQASLSSLQANMGTPTSGETVFGDLHSIQTTLSTLSGLQTSVTNLQNTLNKLSNTSTVSDGSGKVVMGYGYGTTQVKDVFDSPLGPSRDCQVTLTLFTAGTQAGNEIDVFYELSPSVGNAVFFPTPGTDTLGFTVTGSATTVFLTFNATVSIATPITVYYSYTAVCAAS